MESDFSEDMLSVSSETEMLPVWHDEEDAVVRSRFKMKQMNNEWINTGKEYALAREDHPAPLRSTIHKKIFECHARVKTILVCSTHLVIVDFLSNVYVVSDIHKKERVVAEAKIDYFNVADALCVGSKVLLFAKNTPMIKEIDVEKNNDRHGVSGTSLEISDIRKDTGERGYTKALFSERIYMLGEALTALDRDSYEVLYQIQGRFEDMAVVDSHLYCLAPNKDIIIYKDKRVVRKISLDDKFSYRKIVGTDVVYILGGETIKVFHRDFVLITERECGFEPQVLAEGPRYVVMAGSEKSSIRLIEKAGYRGVRNFPKSGMVFPRIGSVVFCGDLLYFGHGRFISSVGL